MDAIPNFVKGGRMHTMCSCYLEGILYGSLYTTFTIFILATVIVTTKKFMKGWQ